MTVDELAALASGALATGEEEAALPRLAGASTKLNDARLHQWTALLNRSLDQHADAIKAFEAAAHIVPDDPLIAHGLARTLMEAGRDARAAYNHARSLAPADGDVLIGLSAAMLAQGDGERAASSLAQILAPNPLWTAGHVHLAQLESLIGRPERATASLDRALAAYPTEPSLWGALFDLAIRSEDYFALNDLVRRAPLSPVETTPFAAIAAAETKRFDEATHLFANLPLTDLPIWRIRHALRTGDTAGALALVDAELAGPAAADAWPYAFLAWRIANDPRYVWLVTDAVRIFDLADGIPLTGLGTTLRALHAVSGQFLDQSVRGGSQTDGPLFSRLEPELRDARAKIVDAVEQYRAELPVPHPGHSPFGHPLLDQRRDRRIRFAGSWSVRLSSNGRHAAHIHPQGWISSALYISLPEGLAETDGWLELGATPTDLGLDLPPTHQIEPRPGRLVLFPSWLWHSTRPFAKGERLTIAFDVAQPR